MVQEENFPQILGRVFTEHTPEVVAFLALSIMAGIWDTHRRWNRIANSFRTKIKLGPNAEYDNRSVSIDSRRFKGLTIVPTEEGLYLAHCGLLPQMFMPKRVLIPWVSLSEIYKTQQSVLGLNVTEYYVDTRDPRGKVQLSLPSVIIQEIVERGFLKEAEKITDKRYSNT
jgi:hypothetical protein